MDLFRDLLFVNLSNQRLKEFGNALVQFGCGIEVLNMILLRKLFGLSQTNLAFTCKIFLVAHQNCANIAITVLLDLVHPNFHILEGLFICDVKNNDNTLGLSKETLCNGFKPFLASCIPYAGLKRHFGAWRGKCFGDVVKTDGCDMVVLKSSLLVQF